MPARCANRSSVVFDRTSLNRASRCALSSSIAHAFRVTAR